MSHKKQLNPPSTLCVIKIPNGSNTASKSNEMRRIHPSYYGLICPFQSADCGEKVGITKQLYISQNDA
jgi:hypothetical protein